MAQASGELLLQPSGQLPFTPAMLGLAGGRKAEALRSEKEMPEPQGSDVSHLSQNGPGEGLEPRWPGRGKNDGPQPSQITSIHSTFPKRLLSTCNVLGTSVPGGYSCEPNRQKLHLPGVHILVGRADHKRQP